MAKDKAIAQQEFIEEAKGLITTPDELTALTMLLYGEPGVGKTTLLCQSQGLIDFDNVLLISIDMGSISVKHRKDLNVVKVSTSAEFSVAMKILQEPSFNYKTVILDSLTQLHKVLMRDLMKTVVKMNPKMADPEVPSQREWGIVSERMQMLLMRLAHQGYHVLCTATERTERDSAGTPMSRPDLPGRLPNHVCEWADIVGRMLARTTEDTVQRVVVLQPGRTWIAKNRCGALGTKIDVKEEIPGKPNTLTFPSMWETILSG